MAKIDYSALAAAIMENVGGSGNVHTVSHCVTRLRFVLKDRSMAKDAEIKQLTGVLGVDLWLGSVSGNSGGKSVSGV